MKIYSNKLQNHSQISGGDPHLTHIGKIMRMHSSPINFVSFTVALGFCLWFPISGLSQGRASNDIHRIDFRNFTYYPTCVNEEGEEKVVIKATKGAYKKKD